MMSQTDLAQIFRKCGVNCNNVRAFITVILYSNGKNNYETAEAIVTSTKHGRLSNNTRIPSKMGLRCSCLRNVSFSSGEREPLVTMTRHRVRAVPRNCISWTVTADVRNGHATLTTHSSLWKIVVDYYTETVFVWVPDENPEFNM